MRAVCKDALSSLNSTDHNSPIVLQKIGFNIISHYMTTRKTTKGNWLSKSGYGIILSALKHLYRSSGVVMDTTIEKDLAQFMGGMKRTVAKRKIEAGESLKEGKKSMSPDVYKLMCNLLYHGEGDDCLFAHAMLTMEWNLMARSENCFATNVNHISNHIFFA